METGIHELTAGYALDALDADERVAYEAHLPGCTTCQQELGSFWETTEALAVAASGPAPSPALRERILADARAEAPQNVVRFEPRRRRLVPVLGAVAAVAAIVALGIGLWGANVSSKLDDTRSALERSEAAAAVLAGPGRAVRWSPGGRRTPRRWRGRACGPHRRRPRSGSCREDLRDVDRAGWKHRCGEPRRPLSRTGRYGDRRDRRHRAGRRPRRGNSGAVWRRGLADNRADRRIGHR